MTTPLQHKIRDYIRSYIGQKGYAPSLREIAAGIGISPKSVSLVSRNVHALAKTGQLKLHKNGYRNIEVANDKRGVVIPLLGRIAAGQPIEAIEDKEMIDLSALFISADHFMLEVRGNSMVDEGIFNGDLVICRPAPRANEGEIVVALVDGYEATLKRISYKIPERITLIPANPTLKPKAYLPQRIQIQGIFVGLLRLKK